MEKYKWQIKQSLENSGIVYVYFMWLLHKHFEFRKCVFKHYPREYGAFKFYA